MAKSTNGNGKRVAVVAGLRTPFAKQSSAYKNLSALELGEMVVSELLTRTGIAPSEIQQLVYGQVLPSLAAPNIARETLNASMSFGIPVPSTISRAMLGAASEGSTWP